MSAITHPMRSNLTAPVELILEQARRDTCAKSVEALEQHAPPSDAKTRLVACSSRYTVWLTTTLRAAERPRPKGVSLPPRALP